MSEFKEKVLSEISFAMVDDAPDLQKLYDKVAATDEHSELNDNQKIVFDYLKSNVEQGGKSVMYSIFLLGDWDSRIGAARNVDIAYCGLNGKQEAEVLAAFAQWGLEQEEAG